MLLCQYVCNFVGRFSLSLSPLLCERTRAITLQSAESGYRRQKAARAFHDYSSRYNVDNANPARLADSSESARRTGQLSRERAPPFINPFRPSERARPLSYAACEQTPDRNHNALWPYARRYFVPTGRIKLKRSSRRYNEEHSANPLAFLMTRPTDEFSAFSSYVQSNWISAPLRA